MVVHYSGRAQILRYTSDEMFEENPDGSVLTAEGIASTSLRLVPGRAVVKRLT
jgi:hypothetical protein